MRDRLEAIVAERRRQLAAAGAEPAPRSTAAPRAFEAALAASRLGVIAEIKRRSPSAGALRERLDAAQLAREYERGGAVAISVLTEPAHFGGSLDDLVRARDAVGVPVLRKDFVFDLRQLDESRAWGADAVLLIARLLGAELPRFLEHAARLRLEALVETHDETDVRRAVEAGARVIGVNNRDLATLSVDRGRAARLRRLVPAGRVTIAESGLRGPADLRTARSAGFDACLIGEALLASERPGATLAGWLEEVS